MTDLSRLSDADLDALMRDISALLLGLPASHNPDPDEQRLDERIRQLVASLAADGVTGYYGAPQSVGWEPNSSADLLLIRREAGLHDLEWHSRRQLVVRVATRHSEATQPLHEE